MLLVDSYLSVEEVVRIIVFVDPRDTMFIDRMFANSKIAISIDSTSYAQCSYEIFKCWCAVVLAVVIGSTTDSMDHVHVFQVMSYLSWRSRWPHKFDEEMSLH